MDNHNEKTNTTDIPTLVVQGFLDKLSEDGIPKNQAKRLGDVLLGEDEVTEYAIKKALFLEDYPTWLR